MKFVLAILLFLIPVNALACSCWSEPVSVSDFMKDVTIVHATPRKTEWLTYQEKPVSQSENWIKLYYNQIKTTLFEVKYLSGQYEKEVPFYHSSNGASCGVIPEMARPKMFILTRDDEGDLTYNYCTASRMPPGAIIDYHANGNDPLIPPRRACYSYERQIKKAKKEGTRPPEDDMNCTFWGKENLRRLNEIRRNYDWTEHISAPVVEE